MPEPVGSDLHVDALMSNLLLAYMNMPSAWIADLIFPEVPVAKQSDLIAEIRKSDFFRDVAELRAPGTRVRASGFGTKKDKTYFCKNYAAAITIDDETRDNQDDPFDVDDIASRLLADRLKLKREKLFGSTFFKTGVWDNEEDFSTASYTQWSEYATSNPPEDIERNALAIESTTGKIARDLTIGRAVWSKLKFNPILMEKIKYTQTAVLTVDLVASLLELDRILVGRAIEVTSGEGASTDEFAFLFGKHALLSHSPDRPSLLVPMAGATFVWNRPNRPGKAYMRRLRLDQEQADKMEGHHYQDQQILGADLGAFFKDVVA